MAIGPETYAWRRRLPHLQRLDRTYFVTFVTLERHVLTGEARTLVLQTLLNGHLRSYALYAAVVMPDHVHVVLTLYEHTTIARTMKFIKSVSARLIAGGPLWQDEYFDRIIRHSEDLRAKGAYVVANPVRAGLVASIDDYRWIWRSWVEGEKSAGEDTRAP